MTLLAIWIYLVSFLNPYYREFTGWWLKKESADRQELGSIGLLRRQTVIARIRVLTAINTSHWPGAFTQHSTMDISRLIKRYSYQTNHLLDLILEKICYTGDLKVNFSINSKVTENKFLSHENIDLNLLFEQQRWLW